MSDSAARLLKLLTLLQSRPSLSGAELAGRLEVTERTVRRDADRLRSLGYPVETTRGVAGGYRLGAGGRMPPLLLDGDEAVAVAVSLRAAAGLGVAGVGEHAVSALIKLGQVLPLALRQRVAAIGAATDTLPGSAPAVDADTLSAIATACHTGTRLRFGYAGRDTDGSGVAKGRHVEPLRLILAGRRWYLVAFDIDRDSWRTFRVDRVGPVLDTRAPSAKREVPDAASLVATSITTTPYHYHARIVFHAPAGHVSERIPPTVGTVEADGPRRCVLQIGSDSLTAMAFHLADFGVPFTILEPPELRDRCREIAARLSQPGEP